MKKVAVIFGTRPEAIKLIPVYFALKEANVEVHLISTGQHREMLNQIFNFFEVKPDIDLDLMTENQDLVDLSSVLLSGLSKVVEDLKPSHILVQGDTTTAMIGSLVGFYKKIKVGHVEAGLRTYNRFSPYPEEVNRRIIGLNADIHFAPTSRAEKTLNDEKLTNIYNVGNTVIDSVLLAKAKVEKNKESYHNTFQFIEDSKKMILITGHRRESFGKAFEDICNAILQLANENPDLIFVYPVHMNPQVKKPVGNILRSVKNVYLIDPVPYDQMVFLMMNAHIILTDSGGIQEEAPSLNIPVIVMRETTERPEGIDEGCAILSGTSHIGITSAFKVIYNDITKWKQMASSPNPYGDGKSSERIAKILSQE
ncbi:UDP-N-acetylglucosamine 2-epimerase (non-hydrolysing) [Ekhidna lutea]|uniref:UDP-N-acetylglucosamine 2-epimerase (non-hydrolyzing) n=1 Tax=Ekhidna lutea TaxID=447679 RepID=A0A239J891_EKHLU|nr:UDP-N-acetylglucosamine 2-epimerase (non-hydrolyzing) [Ekhidna lutea]SNT02009.1 UDP-N-acetylglucosamine 2-epimerase (non-hydrolysing) [Ekhidna lutea]